MNTSQTISARTSLPFDETMNGVSSNAQTVFQKTSDLYLATVNLTNQPTEYLCGVEALQSLPVLKTEFNNLVLALQNLNLALNGAKTLHYDIMEYGVSLVLTTTNQITGNIEVLGKHMSNLLTSFKYKYDDIQPFVELTSSPVVALQRTISSSNVSIAQFITPKYFNETQNSYRLIKESMELLSQFAQLATNLSNYLQSLNNKQMFVKFKTCDTSLVKLYDDLVSISDISHAYNQISYFMDFYRNLLLTMLIDYRIQSFCNNVSSSNISIQVDLILYEASMDLNEFLEKRLLYNNETYISNMIQSFNESIDEIQVGVNFMQKNNVNQSIVTELTDLLEVLQQFKLYFEYLATLQNTAITGATQLEVYSSVTNLTINQIMFEKSASRIQLTIDFPLKSSNDASKFRQSALDYKSSTIGFDDWSASVQECVQKLNVFQSVVSNGVCSAEFISTKIDDIPKNSSVSLHNAAVKLRPIIGYISETIAMFSKNLTSQLSNTQYIQQFKNLTLSFASQTERIIITERLEILRYSWNVNSSANMTVYFANVFRNIHEGLLVFYPNESITITTTSALSSSTTVTTSTSAIPTTSVSPTNITDGQDTTTETATSVSPTNITDGQGTTTETATSVSPTNITDGQDTTTETATSVSPTNITDGQDTTTETATSVSPTNITDGQGTTTETATSVSPTNITDGQGTTTETATSVSPTNITDGQDTTTETATSVSPTNITDGQDTTTETATSVSPTNITDGQGTTTETATSVSPTNITDGQGTTTETATSVSPTNITDGQGTTTETATSVSPTNITDGQGTTTETTTSASPTNITDGQGTTTETATSVSPTNITDGQDTTTETATSVSPTNITDGQDTTTETTTSVSPTNITEDQVTTTVRMWSEWHPWNRCLLIRRQRNATTNETTQTTFNVSCDLVISTQEKVVKIQKIEQIKEQELNTITNHTEGTIKSIETKYKTELITKDVIRVIAIASMVSFISFFIISDVIAAYLFHGKTPKPSKVKKNKTKKKKKKKSIRMKEIKPRILTQENKKIKECFA